MSNEIEKAVTVATEKNAGNVSAEAADAANVLFEDNAFESRLPQRSAARVKYRIVRMVKNGKDVKVGTIGSVDKIQSAPVAEAKPAPDKKTEKESAVKTAEKPKENIPAKVEEDVVKARENIFAKVGENVVKSRENISAKVCENVAKVRENISAAAQKKEIGKKSDEDKVDLSAEPVESTDKTEKKSPKILLPHLLVPVTAALIVLTAGVVVSSASLGFFNRDKEVFVETEQPTSELSEPWGMFMSGISVQGVDLGGLTMEEAKEKLTVTEASLIPPINYNLTCNDKVVNITPDNFEFEFDTVQKLNEAYEYSEYMRRTLIKRGRTELKNSEKKDYPITMTLADGTVRRMCENVAKQVNVAKQDAHVTNIDVSQPELADSFEFAEGIIGYTLNVDDLEKKINSLWKSETYSSNIKTDMQVEQPTYTIEDLKKNLVLISMYTTYSSNTWAGNMNMMVAMESMNGSIIKPGEVFSFNEKTGNSNLAENGYYSAGVIVNGKSAEGIGGGICQAATTIYNAAIRAGMTVVEREPHTWPSVYVPVGVDAAIDYGNIDMKFRNDTDHEVYLICYMDYGVLYAYIYGFEPDNFDEITISSWFTGSTEQGFYAAAQREYYKDGEIVKTEDLPSSYYSVGGGTSYASSEYPSDYEFKHIFGSSDEKNDDTEAAEAAEQPTEEEVY